MSAATCPYCGDPKDAHVFASRTSCVLASEVPDPPSSGAVSDEGPMIAPDSHAAKVRELDPSVPVERLAHLIKHASELQVRLCMWRVTSASDFDALAKDVRGLEADLHDLTEEIKYERGKMGVAS